MAENGDQIFSLKSNLITQFKGVSMNLNQNKNNQHSRLKSFCFSNVLRTIRNDVAKFRVKDPDKDTVESKDKENKGMIIQACNFKNAYVQEAPLVAQPTKSGILHSRSFLIRSFHSKRMDSMSSEPKQGQSQPKPLHIHCSTFDITLKHYKLQSLRELKQQVQIRQRKSPNTIKPLLSILIPIQLARVSKAHLESLGKELMEKNIDIYVVGLRQKYTKQVQQYQQYCNIMTVKSDASTKHKDYYREIVLDFNEQVLDRTGNNILVLCGPPDDNPKNCFYIPFCTKYTQSTEYQEHVPMEINLSYFGLANPTLLKSVEITQDIVHLSITHAHNRKLQLIEHHYPLQQEICLQLSNRQRQQNSSQRCIPPSGEQLQQKLLEYCKIIKKQREVTQSTSTSMQIKNKGARGSLATKSSYQIVNELMRNNANICKQINKYVESLGNMRMDQVFVDCDDILYYLLV